jgi:Tfp pilus assembly protein PilF
MTIEKISRAIALVALLAVAACGSPEQRAQSYYERGMSLLEKGDPVKARIELRNALQIKGDMVAAWRGLARIEEQANNWQGFVGAAQKIAELDPKDITVRIQLARLAFAGGAGAEAKKWVDAAVAIDPKNVPALALRSAVLLRLRDNNGAVQEANKVLAIDPSNVDVLIVLAAEKLSRDDAKGALDLVSDMPAERKNDPGVLLLKIRIFEKLGDVAQIEATLRKLVEVSPPQQQQVFQRELVRFYIAHNRREDAEKEMRGFVEKHPDDSRAGLELVGLLRAVKGEAAAREELANRIKAGGHTFPYEMAMVELDFAGGKVDTGIASLKRLLGTNLSAEDAVAARTRLAELYLSQRDFTNADSVIADILKADNRNVVALRLRAAIKIDRGQLDDAIADLRQALNDQPRSPELLSLLAVAFERQGSIELADKQLSDAMKASNYAPNFGLNYVSFLKRRGITSHLDTVLAELASRNPRSIPVLSALAQYKLEQQDWNGANQIAEAIRRVGNQPGVADEIEAAVLTGQKKYDESVSILESNYEANRGAIGPMLALVRTYVQMKQPEKAQALLESALKSNPDSAEAYILMGFTKLALNDPNDALANFKTAIDKQPKNVAGHRALADYYLRRNDLDAASKAVEAGLKQVPNDFNLRFSRATILERQKNYDAAIAEYDSLLKEQSGSLIVANNLASLLADYRTDQASRDRAYTVALLLVKSQVPQFKDTLGWIYHLRGDDKSALPLLEEAVSELGNVPLVRYHLGMTYAAMGQTAKAAEQFKKASELDPNDSELQKKIRAATN